VGTDRGSHESEKGFEGFLGRLTICTSQSEHIQTLYHKVHAVFGPPLLLQLLALATQKDINPFVVKGHGQLGASLSDTVCLREPQVNLGTMYARGQGMAQEWKPTRSQ